jgi:holliday junction DNA helicase RuvA
MIAYLKGTILNKTTNYLIVETAGVGYKVYSPSTTILNLRKGSEVELFIHTHVREDQLSLYGFLSTDELELFDLLLSVTGVGPKVALAVLSAGTASSIRSAIASGEATVFTNVSGVGRKTAERIVLELKERLVGEGSDGQSSKDFSEALDALLALGYSRLEARSALNQIPQDLPDSRSVIKEALKILGKKK